MNFNSARLRLILITILCISSLITIGAFSVLSLNKSASSIEGLYTQDMQNSNRANKVINLLSAARGALLLAFQHDPSSKFASMHDHPVTFHLNDVDQKLAEIHRLVHNEIIGTKLTKDESAIIRELSDALKKIKELGFDVSINEMKKNDFSNANLILLRVINPEFKKVDKLAHDFLKAKLAAAKNVYIQTEEDLSYFIYKLIIAVAIASVIISFIILKRIHIALTTIRKIAGEVANGDLTQQVKLAGNDEFSDVSKHVDSIVSSFQSVIATMNDSSLQLANAAEESSAIALQTKQNIVEQQQQTQMVATAINEFASTVQEVANNASSAAQASEGADEANIEGKAVVDETISMIVELNKEMRNTKEIIQQLSEQSNQIGSVVDVIENISEQTNLLALNAAIEAARAGEAGRGFAVVADEVRSLASRTQESTVEIKSMISGLQNRSTESLTKMEEGAEQTELTVAVAEKAGVALDKICSSVTQISNLNIQIATAAEQQSVVTDEINQNVASINDISLQTADGAEQNSTASSKLASLTETMKEQVAKFSF